MRIMYDCIYPSGPDQVHAPEVPICSSLPNTGANQVLYILLAIGVCMVVTGLLLYIHSKVKRPHRMRFRTFNRLRAKLNNYFWLPCPLCGRYFGGHEWLIHYDLVATIPDENNERVNIGICPDCTLDGKGRRRDVLRGL